MKQSTGLFLPNLLLRSVAKFGVSCHRFEPYTYLHKNKKDTIRYPFYFGGNNRARTCDPLLVRQVLSRLSYAPVSQLAHYTRRQKNCQGIFGNFFGKCTFSGRQRRPDCSQSVAASAFSASSSVCSCAGVKTYSASQNWQCTCVFLPSAIMSCSSCTPHWRSACSTRAREHAQR